MKKDRIRGKFTVVNEVSVSRPSPRLLLFICIVLNCNPQRAFRLFRPSVVMEIPKEVCNLKDRRSDLYEVRVKK